MIKYVMKGTVPKNMKNACQKAALIVKSVGLFLLCVAGALLVFAYSSEKVPDTSEADAAFDTVYAYGESIQ